MKRKELKRILNSIYVEIEPHRDTKKDIVDYSISFLFGAEIGLFIAYVLMF